MDLSPRTLDAERSPKPSGGPPPKNGPPNRRKWVSIGLLVVVLLAGGVVLTKFLTSSLDYYCNADELGLKSGCEAGRRLRVQGTVDEGSVKAADGVTTFSITFDKVTVPVKYDSNSPGGLFQECIPVVIHGVLQPDGVFDGDDIEVKHSNEYSEKNQDRLDDAESAACSQQP